MGRKLRVYSQKLKAQCACGLSAAGRLTVCRLVLYKLDLLLFAFTFNGFVLGGAVGCLVTAIQHRRLASKIPAVEAHRGLKPVVRQVG
jgi:hypothetical protein